MLDKIDKQEQQTTYRVAYPTSIYQTVRTLKVFETVCSKR